jgi:hypothetical protein
MLSRYRKHGSEKMHSSVFTIGISGISWNQLVTERKAVKGISEQGKRNCQAKAISSEGNHLNNMVK